MKYWEALILSLFSRYFSPTNRKKIFAKINNILLKKRRAVVPITVKGI